MKQLLCVLLALNCTAVAASAAPAARTSNDLDQLKRAFAEPPDETRILMRWWWFGSAVEQSELARELQVMKQAGIGGVEVQPVYPLELDDPKRNIRNVPYLSDEFRKDIGFTAGVASKLGLRMDVTLGSGWPFGGPNTPISAAAGRLRIERVPVASRDHSVPLPSLENGETLLAIFLAKGERREFSASGASRLMAGKDGRVRIPELDSGPHTLIFFVASHTGQQVKRAAVGAEGYVLDHYDRDAIEHHLRTVAEPLLKSFSNLRPYSVFSDSLEVFSSDWTPGLLPEFRKRRGYSLEDHWMALVADDAAEAKAVRHDWGKTLTELAEDNYLKPIRAWAQAHGVRFRSQTYGEPPAILSSNELVDLPEGEAGPRWRSFSTARWASSASHIYGRAVTSSETWTWLHSPAFRATPLDMKAEADLHFLQGINQLVGHGWPYSPAHAGEPGWRFYAAAALNQHNPWFQVMPEITRYLQRMSFLLRQGQPANDVALYLPTDDAWANFKPGKASVDRQMDALIDKDVIPQILDSGYNFDFLDDRGLNAVLAKKSSLWKIILVPGVERIPIETLRQLRRYEQASGKVLVIGRLPSKAPGLLEGKAAPAEFATLAGNLRLIADSQNLGRSLNELLEPDMGFSQTASGALGFIHRKSGAADIYFVANTSNRSLEQELTFRTPQKGCEMWDPFTGRVQSIETRRDGNRAALSLHFVPYESKVLVFRDEVSTPPQRISYGTSKAIALDDLWKVSFPQLQSTNMTRLHSWTDDEGTKYFSGEASYERTVNIQEAVDRVVLDFGPGTAVENTASSSAPGMRALLESPVRESAVVFVNGKRAGSVWHPPYEVDISQFVHKGENQLRIVVGNTAINEIAGSALPGYRLLNLRYGERFVPQGFENIAPLPSGILGPLQLKLEQVH